AHGHVAVLPILRLEACVRLPNRLLELTGEGRGQDRCAYPLPRSLQVGDIRHVQPAELAVDEPLQALGAEEGSVCLGGRGETIRYTDAHRDERAPHLPQRGVFSPHQGDVVETDFVEPDEPWITSGHVLLARCWRVTSSSQDSRAPVEEHREILNRGVGWFPTRRGLARPARRHTSCHPSRGRSE